MYTTHAYLYFRDSTKPAASLSEATVKVVLYSWIWFVEAGKVAGVYCVQDEVSAPVQSEGMSPLWTYHEEPTGSAYCALKSCEVVRPR